MRNREGKNRMRDVMRTWVAEKPQGQMVPKDGTACIHCHLLGLGTGWLVWYLGQELCLSLFCLALWLRGRGMEGCVDKGVGGWMPGGWLGLGKSAAVCAMGCKRISPVVSILCADSGGEALWRGFPAGKAKMKGFGTRKPPWVSFAPSLKKLVSQTAARCDSHPQPADELEHLHIAVLPCQCPSSLSCSPGSSHHLSVFSWHMRHMRRLRGLPWSAHALQLFLLEVFSFFFFPPDRWRLLSVEGRLGISLILTGVSWGSGSHSLISCCVSGTVVTLPFLPVLWRGRLRHRETAQCIFNPALQRHTEARGRFHHSS